MIPSWRIVPIYSLLAFGMIRTISATTHFALKAARKSIENVLGSGACMLFAKWVPVRQGANVHQLSEQAFANLSDDMAQAIIAGRSQIEGLKLSEFELAIFIRQEHKTS